MITPEKAIEDYGVAMDIGTRTVLEDQTTETRKSMDPAGN